MANEESSSSAMKSSEFVELKAMYTQLSEMMVALSTTVQNSIVNHPRTHTENPIIPNIQNPTTSNPIMEDFPVYDSEEEALFEKECKLKEAKRGKRQVDELSDNVREKHKEKINESTQVFQNKGFEAEYEQKMAHLERLRQEIQEQYQFMGKASNLRDQSNWKSGLPAAERATIPHGLKMPHLDKYTGLEDPALFMKMYVATMYPLKLGEATVLQIFPRYLTGSALRWYHKKNIGDLEKIDDLASAFIGRFNMHTNFENPKKKLRNMKQGPHEKFRVFLNRWKEVASEVDDLPDEEQQISMIMDGLNEKYGAHLASHDFTSFRALVKAGSNLDDVFAGRDSATQSAPKFVRKPKTEVNNIENVWKSEERIVNQQNFKGQNVHFNANRVEQRPTPRRTTTTEQPMRHFDDIGMPLSKALILFKRRQLIECLAPRTDVTQLGRRPSDFCEYHQMVGHSTDFCMSLKNKIQDMIDNKIITKPNVQKNPLPKHDVHMVEIEEHESLENDISELIVDIDEDRERITCVIDIWADVVEVEEEKPTKAKGKAINLWTDGFETIDIWAEGIEEDEVNVTRKGTDYQPVFLKTTHVERNNEPAQSSNKGKEKVIEPTDNLLNQLKKTSANVSMWELLMCSVNHRQAVLNELSKFEISVDTTPEQLVGMIIQEQKGNTIAFGDEDLPTTGSSHARALYITVQVGQKTIPLALIDNGSALNICPWRTAEKIGVKKEDILPSDLCVKGFDSAKREIMGNLKLIVKVAGVPFEVEFCILDIQPSYNLILGRPWLHQSKALASTLHQKLKFVHSGRIITIEGDTYTLANSGTSHVSQNDVELNGFEISPIFIGECDQIADFPRFGKPVLLMMADMNYFLGMGLGKHGQGIVNPIQVNDNRDAHGLGYLSDSVDDDLSRGRPDRPHLYIPPTLNGQFVREGETTLCFDFPEPFNHPITNKKLPGFGIFGACPIKPSNLSFSVCNARKTVDDWEQTLEGLSRLFQEPQRGVARRSEPTVHISRHYQLGAGVGPEDLICNDNENEVYTDAEEEVDPFVSQFVAGADELKTRRTRKLEPEEAISEKSISPVLDDLNNLNSISDIDKNADVSEYLHVSDSQYFDSQTPYEVKKYFENEDEIISSAEDTIEVNLNNENEPQIILIGKSLSKTEQNDLIKLLKINKNVFAWSYRDMPGIDPEIVQHHIPLYPDFKPVKQKLRRMRADLVQKIKDEVEKQIDAGFLEVVEYPQWVANIVPVPKKDGKIRVCVDYRDLNKASPKDNFPLPHIDILVDQAAGHELLSFMDGFSGYNQVLMAPEDKHKTTFITEMGTFCYRVMPFGLKNAGATYQRAATTLLHDMIHKEVEVYVDDMIVKSKKREEHLQNLEKFLNRIGKYQLRLNPKKCTFGVKAGKMLGFLITQRGIEVDPSKIEAITAMPVPKNEKDVRSFLGKIQYVSRFISKLTMTCDPLFKLLRKNEKFTWDNDCQHAFDKIKQYLLSPPILMSPKAGVPLTLYLTVTDTAMGSLLAQENDEKTEVAVYYVSKRMTGYELKYSRIEKVCWALAWVTKRLRHYMQAHQIKLISRLDPLRYLFQKTLLSPRLSKWMMMISEYDIEYINQKSIKGSVVADFLADNPIDVEDGEELMFPDEEILNVEEQGWTLRFDGASGQQGYGVGILLIDPNGTYNPISIKLEYPVTNNEAEYEACLLGMKAAFEKGAKKLEVIGDSNLVISQANGVWQVKGENLKPYHKYLTKLISKFDQVTFTHAPRCQNRFADALATLAAMTQIPDGIKIKPLKIRQQQDQFIKGNEIATNETVVKPWYWLLQNYLEKGEYPINFQKKERRALRQYATNYVMVAGKIYRRSYDGQNMLCVSQNEAKKIMSEVHEGTCGPHMNGLALAKKILRFGYYWQNLEHDCIAYVKSCHKCQIYANLKHTPASLLYNMTSPWPFSTWGIDIIGKIYPHASNGHEFILVAIDYFTKWVEAVSYKVLKSTQVAKFIRNNIICRYGVPHSMISDNGKDFEGEVLKVLAEYKIEHHKSSPYRPQTNGAVEAANKNVMSILKKTTQTYKDWHEKLPYALWGYRTTARTSTGETPYSLVYGMDAVQPIEIEFPTLRVMLETRVIEEDWAKSRYDQLTLMEDRRLDALCKTQAYQKRISSAFNKKVQPRNIREGDLVLKKTRKLIDPRGKFQPQWEGPFVVRKILSGGAVRLANNDGNELSAPFNLDTLKRYFA